ncbi:hypothetical protein JL720_12574 [Aureococcus anophagefferens]|nr:hypothetical protein JL720_12574 [Aureococcus anophagefferens]
MVRLRRLPDPTHRAGSTGYADASGLTYDASTGKFAGAMITNGCNDQPRIYGLVLQRPVVLRVRVADDPGLRRQRGPADARRAGMTLSGGVNIYSAFEAGFNDCDDGQPCACTGAECEGGVDVHTCEAHLEYACVVGQDAVKKEVKKAPPKKEAAKPDPLFQATPRNFRVGGDIQPAT